MSEAPKVCMENSQGIPFEERWTQFSDVLKYCGVILLFALLIEGAIIGVCLFTRAKKRYVEDAKARAIDRVNKMDLKKF